MSAFFSPHFLKDRRYLVTGATGGAGSRTAIELSRVGAKCTLVARDADKAEKVLRELQGSGHTVHLYNSVGLNFDGLAQFDGIFHASGAEWMRRANMMEDGDWAKVSSPSVSVGAGLIANAVSKKEGGLVKDGGSIVFMSSVAATHGQAGMMLYHASKGAIEALVRAAAVELAPRRIRVNAIRAGGFASPMHSRITQRMTEDAIDAYANRHLLGFGRTEDIANAALFLLGDTSKWVTGSCMVVDGGYSAK